MKAAKTVNLYEVRYFPKGSAVSRNLSKKCKILPYKKARRVVARLRKFGVDATVGSPWRVNV